MSDKYTTIQIRRVKDTSKDFDSDVCSNIIPKYGELIFSHTNTTDELVIGDNTRTIPNLPRLRVGDLNSFITPSASGNTKYYAVYKDDYTTEVGANNKPVYVNASGKITAIGTGTAIGTSNKPVYLSSTGVITACSIYAGGTAVTLNGTSKVANVAGFYAPTASGTSGQILQSKGSGFAPEWVNQSALTGVFGALSSSNNSLSATIGGTTKSANIVNSISNTWVAGTTSGPKIYTTVNGESSTSVAIPVASSTASGVVTTGAQTFAGVKTFSSTISGSINGNAATATLADKATILATGRTLKVKLDSTSASTAFNGSANITDIGVSGILPVANGGTGKSSGTIPRITVATTAPSSPSTGDMYFNSNTGVLQFYTGSAWKSVVGVWG